MILELKSYSVEIEEWVCLFSCVMTLCLCVGSPDNRRSGEQYGQGGSLTVCGSAYINEIVSGRSEFTGWAVCVVIATLGGRVQGAYMFVEINCRHFCRPESCESLFANRREDL